MQNQNDTSATTATNDLFPLSPDTIRRLFEEQELRMQKHTRKRVPHLSFR